MPTLKSSKKRLRQANRARLRNKAVRTRMRSTLRKVQTAATKADAEALFPQAQSVIDRTLKNGIIHRNAAARYKSKIAHHIAGLEA